jgi:polar amino acid transport system substrate-binding protein
VLLVLVAAACDLPRDPEGTLERVRGGVIRVGVIDHAPWVVHGNGDPTGVEVALMQGFARTQDANIRWIEGPEGRLLRALEDGEVDLVVGGLTRERPWDRRLEPSRPYFESRVLLGVPPGDPPPESVEGMEVAVQDGTHVAALVADEGGVPVRMESLEEAPGPVAAEEWRVRALGLRPTDVVLETSAHVVVVVPGENAFRVAIERYLFDRRTEVPGLLEEAVA